MSVFLHDWEKSGLQGMMEDFEIKPDALQGAEVLVATYTYEDYSGDAFVLLKRGDDLFEVNGSHCSCYGLEGQWDMEPTTKEAVLHRIENGSIWDELVKAKAEIAAAIAA